MKDLWFDAYEEACADLEGGEPTDEAVEAKYRERVDALIDHADMLRKRQREEG